MLEKYSVEKPIKKVSTLYKRICLFAVFIAAVIALFILFYPPMPGVADQGDFQRVMTVTGLEMANNPDPYWFKYVTTNYKFTTLDLSRLKGSTPTTSMIYPITLVRAASKLIGIEYFNTRFLALIYVLIYLLSLYICIRCLRFKRLFTGIFFIIASLFILFDGNYIVWFNSLYGEPMMIVGLLLLISSVLYASNRLDSEYPNVILFVFAASLLFLGSKLQCFAALPFIILFIIRIALLQNPVASYAKLEIPVTVSIIMLTFYVSGIYQQINNTCGIDTRYNSVFYGILKSSLDPKKDLAVLGLPPDMAVESGKHAYLSRDKYVKYAPGSELTKNEFNSKISNLKLLRFYLLQPQRLIKGMDYTASKAFNTGTSLGKYEKSAVKKYTYTFNRFTLWSNFRSSMLPKKMLFLTLFYFLIILVSVIEYIKRRGNKVDRLHIELLWLIIVIGLLQFPMPYIGNGEADTSKQLFLFNYTFDLTFLVACTWILDKIHVPISNFIKSPCTKKH